MYEPPSNISINHLLGELEQVFDAGRAFGSWHMIDEEAFFLATAKLRRFMPPVAVSLPVGQPIDVFRRLDLLEKIVENGKGHFFGKVMVNAAEYKETAAGLRAELSRSSQFDTPLVSLTPVPTATTDALQSANEQARQIIESAQREAQRIIDEARRQAGQGNSGPWSS